MTTSSPLEQIRDEALVRALGNGSPENKQAYMRIVFDVERELHGRAQQARWDEQNAQAAKTMTVPTLTGTKRKPTGKKSPKKLKR